MRRVGNIDFEIKISRDTYADTIVLRQEKPDSHIDIIAFPIRDIPALLDAIAKEAGLEIEVKVKNQPPDLTAGEFNRGE